MWDNPRLLNGISAGLLVVAGLLVSWGAYYSVVTSQLFPLRVVRVQAVQGHLRQGNAWRVRGDHTAQALHVYHTVRVRYVRVQYRRQGVDHGAGLRGATRHASFNGREIFEDGGLRADRAQEHAGVSASACDSGTNRCAK